jgi:LysR family cyn operon transcriptional activator
LANRLDVGICLLPVASDRIVTIRLFNETLCLVGSSRFPLPGRRMRMKDLAALPLVLLPSDYCLRKMIEAECAEAGVRPHVSVEMTSPEGILDAVKQGVGLTILPELYVRQRLGGTNLRIMDLYEPVPRHAVGVAYRAHRYMSKAAQEFVRLCRLTLKELHANAHRIWQTASRPVPRI